MATNIPKAILNKVIEDLSSNTGWQETERRAVGLYASGPVQGPGWENKGYYQAIYEVTWTKVLFGIRFFKRTAESGPSIRYYGEGYDAFCSLFKSYFSLACHPGALSDGEEQHGITPRWQREVTTPAFKTKLANKLANEFMERVKNEQKSKKNL